MRLSTFALPVFALCALVASYSVWFAGASSPIVQVFTGPNEIQAATLKMRTLSSAHKTVTPISVGHGANPSVSMCELDFAAQKARPWEYPMFKDLVKTCRARSASTLNDLRKSTSAGRFIEPTGFVFHESRCGSTLTANLLASIPNALLFSESSPPIQAVAACRQCSRQERVEILRTVVRAMGATGDYDHLFFKFQSVMTLEMDLLLEAFPDTPWIFVYRDPVEVMMSHMKSGAHAPCVRSKRAPTEHHIRYLGGSAEARASGTEQFCAAHLAVLQEMALKHMNKPDSRGVPVNHKQLPDYLIDEVLPRHFRVPVSADLRETMVSVASQYSKARTPSKSWVEDSQKKQDAANDQVKRWANQYMMGVYTQLSEFQPQLASAVVSESAARVVAAAPVAPEGGAVVSARGDDSVGSGPRLTGPGWTRFKPDSTSFYEPHCPLMPPAGYPHHFPLLDVLSNWSPDDPDPPAQHYDALCYFDYQTQREAAENYRQAELPFVVYNVPNMNELQQKWSPEYFSKKMGGRAHRTEISENNHFMYWTTGRRSKTPPGWKPPTRIEKFTYDDFHNLAVEADRVKMPADETHFYFRVEGDQDAWVKEDLEIFKPRKSFFIVEEAKHRGIHCRFGMRGVLAECHFDGGRNMIAMIQGRKRYILAPPAECEQVYMYPAGHPSGRHTEVDWANIDLQKHPKMAQAQFNEVILSSGEVMYLPSFWLHHIISMEVSVQCNCRSGIKGGRQDVRKCGFP